MVSLARSGTASRLLRGVFSPLPTIFEGTHCERIDTGAMQHNLEYWLAGERKPGLCVLGTNGEFALLTEKEQQLVLSTVAKAGKASEATLIAGTGAPGTMATIRNTQMAADMGYDAAMVVTPYYFTSRMGDAALKHHFEAVASASPIPIVLYNMPAAAGGVKLSVSCVSSLARHENIIGLKDSGGNAEDVLAYVTATDGEDFSVMAGSASVLVESLANGATGGIMALANVLGPELLDIYHDTVAAIEAGESIEDIRQRNDLLVHLNRLVTAEHSVPGLKHAMDLTPGLVGGLARSPHLPLEESAAASIEAALAAARKP